MFSTDTENFRHSYISPTWELFYFSRNIQYFLYVFVSGKLKDEAFERLYNNNLSLKDSVEANIEDMDNVSININYSSIVENTLSYDFNLNQDRNSYKRLADLFVDAQRNEQQGRLYLSL